MDILEYAMQMELDGKDFYMKGADQTSAPAIKKIFKTLATEEHRHYQFFKSLKDENKQDVQEAETNKADSLKLVKNVFQEMVEAGKDQLECDTTKTVWEEALEVERKTERLYRDAADKETDEQKKKLLNIIADEEKSHIYLIDNILNFLNDPETFAASQNYKNFKSWEGR